MRTALNLTTALATTTLICGSGLLAQSTVPVASVGLTTPLTAGTVLSEDVAVRLGRKGGGKTWRGAIGRSAAQRPPPRLQSPSPPQTSGLRWRAPAHQRAIPTRERSR